MKIRFVETTDAKDLLKIYKPYVEQTVISFECVVPSIDEMKLRINTISKKFPYLVCIKDCNVVGYAYANTYRSRSAFDTSVELSVYVDQAYHGQKIGKILYETLLKLLTFQGFKMAYGCIALPNDISEKLHESFGFNEVGIFHQSGYKFNQYVSVKFYEKELHDGHCKIKSVEEVKDYFNNS